MLLLKACPRCQRGDLIVEREEYGPVVNCLQCGYVGDFAMLRRHIAPVAVIRATPERVEAKAA